MNGKKDLRIPIVYLTRRETFSAAHRLYKWIWRINKKQISIKFNIVLFSVWISVSKKIKRYLANAIIHMVTIMLVSFSEWLILLILDYFTCFFLFEIVEVTVKGPVDPNTGMVINISVLKVFIQVNL